MKTTLLYFCGILLFASVVWLSLTGNAEKCIELEAEAKLILAEANYCEVSAECRAIAFGCPFDCESLINARESEKVMSLIGNYHSNCMMICPDNCSKDAAPLLCVSGECVRRGAIRE